MHSRRVTSLLTVRKPRPISELPGILNNGQSEVLHVSGTEKKKEIMFNELAAFELTVQPNEII